MKKIFIILSFLLGVLSCAIGQYFLKERCHPFPHFEQKYKFEALLTPQKHLERIKAKAPPKTIILCYDDKFLKRVLQKYRTKECGGYFSDVYFLTDHPLIAVVKFGWTAPLNAMKLELVIAWGVKQIIAIGTSCGLQEDISIGDILVCEKSIRDEGTSHHYLPYSKYAYPSQKLLEKLLLTLKETNKPYKTGASWTTDAFYRVTKEEVEQYQKEGVLCVEMEAAALFSVASFRNVDMIAIFTITDSYAKLKWEKDPGYKEKKFKALDNLFEIALQVASKKNKRKNI